MPARVGLTDPDDIPETPKNPVSRVGDIWTLGKHRLMCGDATKPEHVERLLDGAFGKSTNDDTSDWQAAYALFPGSIAYVWM